MQGHDCQIWLRRSCFMGGSASPLKQGQLRGGEGQLGVCGMSCERCPWWRWMFTASRVVSLIQAPRCEVRDVLNSRLLNLDVTTKFDHPKAAQRFFGPHSRYVQIVPYPTMLSYRLVARWIIAPLQHRSSLFRNATSLRNSATLSCYLFPTPSPILRMRLL